MSRRDDRFLHLESAPRRSGGPEERPRLQGGERFESPVAPGEVEAAGERVAEAHVARFRHPGEAPLALDTSVPEGLPFVRCARCEMDNSRFTQRCTRCGADLGTAEQVAFNAELLRVRQQEEAEARAGLEALKQPAAALDPREVERMMEALRREERAGTWGRVLRRAEGTRLGALLQGRGLGAAVVAAFALLALLARRGSALEALAFTGFALALGWAVHRWLVGRPDGE